MLALERSPRGWLLSSTDYEKIIRLTSKQVREFFLKLNQEKFDDAYLSRKNPDDLIIVIEGEKVRIKNYLQIKSRPYIKEIKQKVDRALLKRIVGNVNKNLQGRGIKILAASLALTGVICILPKYANLDIQPNTLDETSSYEVDADDYEFVEELTLDDIIKEEVRDKQNSIKKYIEYYGQIFSIPIDIQQQLYSNNESNLLASSKIEDDIITIMFDYYFNNMYEQMPLEYNGADDITQQITSIL